ncbi:MAG: hypothetical protein ACKVQB_11910 [Bacteroidia bacterium]
MKAIKILFFSIIAFSFSGCGNELFDIKFGLQTQEAYYTIKPTTAAGAIALDTAVESVNLDSFATVNGIKDMSLLKSFKVKKIKIIIESPATANFDIVNSGIIFLGAQDLPTVEIARFSNIPAGAREFEIIPEDVNLLDYGRKPNIWTWGVLNTNGPVTEEIKLKFLIDYEAIANPTP